MFKEFVLERSNCASNFCKIVDARYIVILQTMTGVHKFQVEPQGVVE